MCGKRKLQIALGQTSWT